MVKEEFEYWNLEGPSVWKRGTENPMTAWFTDVELDKLGDPNNEASELHFKANCHMTDKMGGCLIQVQILLWSRNNPHKKYKFVEVIESSLNVRKTSQKVDVKIPLIKDIPFNEGL